MFTQYGKSKEEEKLHVIVSLTSQVRFIAGNFALFCQKLGSRATLPDWRSAFQHSAVKLSEVNGT